MMVHWCKGKGPLICSTSEKQNYFYGFIKRHKCSYKPNKWRQQLNKQKNGCSREKKLSEGKICLKDKSTMVG